MDTTLQMSPVSILSLMNSTKPQRLSFCLQVIEALENGNADPLQVHIYLKNLEAIFKTFTDEKTGKQMAERYKSALLDAAAKQGGKTFELYNAKFQVKEAGHKYDWSVCNDPVINDLLCQQIELDAKIKERTEFLKTVPDAGLLITDEATGETNSVYHPNVSSTTTIAVTLS